ncbi:SDR family oxidoreductase [Sphingomonas sp.]|uniref:SDR family oxidoreductase n=1 Tax=Sphingomonas sp. TaxID=28214 RepID=UPI003B3AF7D0
MTRYCLPKRRREDQASAAGTIAVIGASGRIGRKLIAQLRRQSHRVVPISRSLGIDCTTYDSLARALEGVDTVIDVSDSGSTDGAAAMRYFRTAGCNLLQAARAGGVRHHIALSVVGVDRLTGPDYFRAKRLQEDLVRGSTLPFTILRATQFFELVRDLVRAGSARAIPIAPALVQPVAGDDIADFLADQASAMPTYDIVELAGPEQLRLDQIAIEIATAHEDDRRVVRDLNARYCGARLEERSLLPGPCAHIGNRRFDDWLRDSLQPCFSFQAA